MISLLLMNLAYGVIIWTALIGGTWLIISGVRTVVRKARSSNG